MDYGTGRPGGWGAHSYGTGLLPIKGFGPGIFKRLALDPFWHGSIRWNPFLKEFFPQPGTPRGRKKGQGLVLSFRFHLDPSLFKFSFKGDSIGANWGGPFRLKGTKTPGALWRRNLVSGSKPRGLKRSFQGKGWIDLGKGRGSFPSFPTNVPSGPPGLQMGLVSIQGAFLHSQFPFPFGSISEGDPWSPFLGSKTFPGFKGKAGIFPPRGLTRPGSLGQKVIGGIVPGHFETGVCRFVPSQWRVPTKKTRGFHTRGGQ